MRSAGEEVLTEALRSMTPAERIAQVDAMWRSLRTMILSQLRRDHPEWAERKLSQEVARRMSHGAVGDPAAGDRRP
jgi:hypothetical protein